MTAATYSALAGQRRDLSPRSVCGPGWRCAMAASSSESTPAPVSSWQVMSPASRRAASFRLWEALPHKGADSRGTRAKFTKAERAAFKAEQAAPGACFLGRSREERSAELFKAAEFGDAEKMTRLLIAGVDVDAFNGYGQTATMIASWLGHASVVRLLAAAGADLNRPSNGGIVTPWRTAVANGHTEVMSVLTEFGARTFPSGSSAPDDIATARTTLFDRSLAELAAIIWKMERQVSDAECAAAEASAWHATSAVVAIALPPPTRLITMSEHNASVIIAPDDPHPGAGSFVVDDAFSTEFMDALDARLDALLRHTDAAHPSGTHDNTDAEHHFFADEERFAGKAILEALQSAPETAGRFSTVHPFMRFLRYVEPGQRLAPHTDAAKYGVNDPAKRFSTHSFCLFLADCQQGGETLLLKTLPGGGYASKKFDDANVEPVAAIKPKRGRLFVFPHVCPHAGAPVVSVPKLLLRGELF